MLQKLGWEELQTRRLQNKAIMMYKIVNNLVETPVGVSTQLQPSGLVAHENSTFRILALAVSGPFMA